MGRSVSITNNLNLQQSHTTRIIAIVVFFLVGISLGIYSPMKQPPAAKPEVTEIETIYNLNPPLTIEQQKEMVFVEGGTFLMGSNEGGKNEKPVHQVTVNSFLIGKYEITDELSEIVGKYNPVPIFNDSVPLGAYKISNDIAGTFDFCNKMSKMEGLNPAYKIIKKRVDRDSSSDVIFIEWEVICDFNSNGYRLPTEAEWEFAARGGKKSKGYKYSGSNNIDEVAVYLNGGSSQIGVGTKKPNELGIYDMSGRQNEMCWDFLGDYIPANQTNPRGPDSGNARVIRGGSWMDTREVCTVTNRSADSPNRMYYWPIGLRLVRTK